jgi:hypothetical protein
MMRLGVDHHGFRLVRRGKKYFAMAQRNDGVFCPVQHEKRRFDATAKAARDATVLATALKRARQNVDAGLRSFEDTQLDMAGTSWITAWRSANAGPPNRHGNRNHKEGHSAGKK